MSHKTRKAYAAEEKVAILRLHLLEQTPVSDLCDQYQLHPTQFYRWQRQFFENGAVAFTLSTRSATAALEQQIAVLQAKLARKHEVLSELMEDYVRLKKERGEP
jgi:transposase-like protein